MTIKVDKTLVVVLIICLLFGNLIYMWGRYNGSTVIYLQDSSKEELNLMQEQIEIMRTQLSQLKP